MTTHFEKLYRLYELRKIVKDEGVEDFDIIAEYNELRDYIEVVYSDTKIILRFYKLHDIISSSNDNNNLNVEYNNLYYYIKQFSDSIDKTCETD